MSAPPHLVSPLGVTAVGDRPTISANELRYLAEKADSIRDERAELVINAEGKVDVVRASELNGGAVLLDLKTEPRGVGVPGDAKIYIEWRGKMYGGPASGDLFNADAAFVTQSAIQKFLLPYYMRFRSGAEVQGIENKLFNDPGVALGIHIPPSIPLGFPRIAAVRLREPDRVEIEEA